MWLDVISKNLVINEVKVTCLQIRLRDIKESMQLTRFRIKT
jgi:hypothetical protein